MKQRMACVAALGALVVGCATFAYFGLGWVPVIIVGGPGLLAVLFWYRTYLTRPTDPAIIVPLFLFTRLAELAMLIFPLLRPSLQPEIVHSISQAVASGTYVADMPNHYWRTTGSYYFPGMYSVVLPILPAIHALYRIWRARPFNSAF
jgi:hypothetical protein